MSSRRGLQRHPKGVFSILLGMSTVVCATLILTVVALEVRYLRIASSIHGGVPRRTEREIEATLRNGDVMFFAASRPPLSVRMAGGTLGTILYHACVVVRWPQMPAHLLHFVHKSDRQFFAAHPVPGCNPGGLMMSSALRVLQSYGSGATAAILPIDVERSADAIWGAALHAGCAARYDDHVQMRAVLSLLGLSGSSRPSPDGVMSCHSFVGRLMERLGILLRTPEHLVTYLPGKTEGLLRDSGAFRAVYVAIVA